MDMMTEAQIREKYGEPGKHITAISLPYPMRIAWDLNTKIIKMQCHELIGERFQAVFSDLLLHYGLPELQRLEIDKYGGCYNYRKMRNGNSWSRHSWGIALDLNPEENSLQTPWKLAQFSKPEYQPMIDIFYKHNFFSLGKERNMDAMHFESSI